MAFQRDHGTCCFVLPLKLGAGIIIMNAIVCILALLTGDIRFQANGYSLATYSLPSAIGALGLLVGFVGLLGVYDDKPLLLKVFNWWLSLKIVAQLVAAIADYLMLRKCDSWLNTTEHLTAHNVQMDALAKQEVCPFARWAYIVGAGIDICFWCYMAVRSFSYQWQIELSPPTKIDFGREQYDTEARWRLFQVRNPVTGKRRSVLEDTKNDLSYGSVEEQKEEGPLDEDKDHEASYIYAPDGQRVLRRPAASMLAPDQPAYNPDGTVAQIASGGFTPAPRGNQSEMVPM